MIFTMHEPIGINYSILFFKQIVILCDFSIKRLRTLEDEKISEKQKVSLPTAVHGLSIIYSSRILCLSSCRPVIFLSYSCHSCGTLSYSLCFSDQTDQGNETEGLEMEGL